jgi:hypothetical protein
LPCGASWPHLQSGPPVGPSVSLPVAMAVPHRPLGCIYVVPQVSLIQGLMLQALTYINKPLPPPWGILKP